MKPVLEINALKKYYGKSANPTKALDGITFQVMAGEFLGIMGSSGSGKSTLLNCIATVIRPDSGSIIWSRSSSFWITSPERKISSCPCPSRMCRRRKAANACTAWPTIWKSGMYWINFPPRCPAARSSGWQPPGP